MSSLNAGLVRQPETEVRAVTATTAVTGTVLQETAEALADSVLKGDLKAGTTTAAPITANRQTTAATILKCFRNGKIR